MPRKTNAPVSDVEVTFGGFNEAAARCRGKLGRLLFPRPRPPGLQ